MISTISRFSFVFILICFCQIGAQSQVFNDFCNSAFNIDNPEGFCSDAGEFTNVNALPSGIDNPMCWSNALSNIDNDVWFTFVAVGNTVAVNVLGAAGDTPELQGGTINSPEIALYTGNCDNPTEEGCATDFSGANVAEFTIPDLTIGVRYFLRVSGVDDNVGTFRLCVNSFNAVPEPNADCASSVILCDQSGFVVDQLIGVGNAPDVLPLSDCSGPGCEWVETNSSWYTWTCDQSGSLAFTLTPLRDDDDLDFALYELPNGINDCSGLIELRCMLSGAITNQPFSVWEPCSGPTGLSFAESDTGESCGCDSGDNNFVSAVNIVEGRVYGLLVNNFSETGNGFSIEFSGTSTFLGPEANFSVSADTIQCDRTVMISDSSSFVGGNIINTTFAFGQGAEPPTATGVGPHAVTYTRFGPNVIALTVETDEGCIVTETIPIEVLSCCELDGELETGIVSTTNPNCSDSMDGAISVFASGGDPEFSFSLDGGPFVASPNFFNLGAGSFNIDVLDIKGCEGVIDADLLAPPPLIVDAGPDQTVDLGFSTNIFAGISPDPNGVDIFWTPDTLLSCNNCLNPTVIPPGETTYTISVVNEAGCVDTDEITIFVTDNRPVFIPNAFSPNGDGRNDFTAVFAGPAAVIVNEMSIYDRWGEEVWRGVNLPLNDFNSGWDGTFRGEPMNQGVFVYQANIGFIDGVSLLFKGDITLLR